jgi:hypothetical protein
MIDRTLPAGAAETLVTVYGPGQFTGEVNMPSGRPAILGGNIKRVASAVSEGSIAVSFVHQALHE